MIDNYMEGIKGRRGVYDYYTVCDDSNNSADDIDNCESQSPQSARSRAVSDADGGLDNQSGVCVTEHGDH